jgi:hypothetical protein
MGVNTGGDPGRDDYGLPPVDIEIPDDARELDREVQAYYRELRSRRRRMLAKRVYGPLASDGMVLPLLAGCLALTLLAATLLTVFTVGQGTVGGLVDHPHAPAPRSPAPGQVGGPLPDAMVMLGGQQMHLADITGSYVVVLALVPPGCVRQCLKDLRELLKEAQQGHAEPYLVSTSGEDMTPLSHQLGLSSQLAVQAEQGPLPPYYRTKILTAVLVGRDGSVAERVQDQNGFQIAAESLSLASASPGINQPSMSRASPAG